MGALVSNARPKWSATGEISEIRTTCSYAAISGESSILIGVTGGYEPRSDEPGSVLHTGPFHAALRAAIRERGLTLDRLRSRLAQRGIRIGLSSLSNWQQGVSRPESSTSLRAVEALEEILLLPVGALGRLLDARRYPDRSTGPSKGARRQEGLDEHAGALAELLDDLPGSRLRDVDVLSCQEKAVVGADRRVSRVYSRTLLRARRDGVDRFVTRYFGDLGCAIGEVIVQPGENCRLGRVLRHPHAPVMVAELLFGTVLAEGDTWVFDDVLIGASGSICVEHAHGFRHSVGQYLLEVRFHQEVLPFDCHAYARPSLDDAPHRTGSLALNAHHAVHLVAHDVTAGVLGIGWSWP
jgi:hypothetical protein